MIQEAVIHAFHDEIERSKLPGYVPSYDDFEDIEFERPPRRSKPAPAREKSNCEKTHLQPAETVPRAPHTLPAQPAAQATDKHNSFGAGIW
jgi:hypothetical protein